jgi:hypothetical protein
MENLRNIILPTLFAILLMASCKKSEDKGDTVFIHNGSVNGTLKGTKADNSILNETFSYSTYLDVLYDQYYLVTSSGYTFEVDFSIPDGSATNLKFTAISATDNAPVVVNYNITYYKTISNTVTYNFSMSNTNNTVTISDFSFNEATGLLKFKLVATGTNNTTKNAANIGAEYNIVLKKLYN